MEIIVQQRQVLDNEEIFNCETIYESVENLRSAVVKIVENWSNMQGNDAMKLAITKDDCHSLI